MILIIGWMVTYVGGGGVVVVSVVGDGVGGAVFAVEPLLAACVVGI